MKLSNPKLATLSLDTGSPAGIGFWSEVCPKRQTMKKLHPEVVDLGTPNMQAGSVGHALMAQHFLGKQVDTAKVRFEPTPDPKAEASGVKMFRQWRARYPSVSHFGCVEHVELLVDVGKDCEESFGVPYTCRVDLATTVTKSVGRALKDTYHLARPLSSGLWIVDHKFHKSDWQFDPTPYREGLQSAGYQLAFWWMTGQLPQGMMFNHVFLDGDAKLTVCPPPSKDQSEMFVSWLIGAKRRREATLGWANAAACWYPNRCIFRTLYLCTGA